MLKFGLDANFITTYDLPGAVFFYMGHHFTINKFVGGINVQAISSKKRKQPIFSLCPHTKYIHTHTMSEIQGADTLCKNPQQNQSV